MTTAHTLNPQHTSVGILDRAASLLTGISIAIGASTVLLMVVNVFVDVLFRFTLNQPIQGTTEMVKYWWMLPIVFLGIAAAQRFREHTDLPILYDMLDHRGQAILKMIALACASIFVGYVGYYGLLNALDQLTIGEFDATTGIVLWPPRFVVPLACLAFIVIAIAQAASTIADLGRQNSLPAAARTTDKSTESVEI